MRSKTQLFFRNFFLVVAVISSLLLTACGGGGGSSNSSLPPTTAKVKVSIPANLFDDANLTPDVRAAITLQTLKIRAVPYNNGSVVGGVQQLEKEAPLTNGNYVANLDLGTNFDYRFLALHNDKELLKNHVSIASITSGASFNVDINTSYKTMAYDAWLANNPTDKSFKNFTAKSAESNLKNDSDFANVVNFQDNVYKESLIKIAKGQQASLPTISDVDVSNIPTSGSSSGDDPKEMVFELNSDEGNIVTDNLYKINPSFTIRYTGPQIADSNRAIIENSIAVTDLTKDKIVITWNDDGTITVSFSGNLAYNTSYTLSMSDLSDINGCKVISFKALSFTTVKEVSEIDNGLSFSLPDGTSLDIISCPEGVFYMGSLKEELGRSENEEFHQVKITKSFYIGKYEVTQAQYKALMGKYPSEYSQDTSKPVYTVSYEDAKAFCNLLNTRFANSIPNGYTFDLPTEAQWEYACRAGTTTSLNSGKDITTAADVECQNLDEVGWYINNSDSTSHPVGQKKSNKWGIYDMHGNVAEWVRDWYADDYDNGDQGEVGYLWNDPTGPETGEYRVVKGGSYYSAPYECRSAHRFGLSPTVNDNKFLGFRVALVPIQ